jgi:hypothetical protein
MHAEPKNAKTLGLIFSFVLLISGCATINIPTKLEFDDRAEKEARYVSLVLPFHSCEGIDGKTFSLAYNDHFNNLPFVEMFDMKASASSGNPVVVKLPIENFQKLFMDRLVYHLTERCQASLVPVAPLNDHNITVDFRTLALQISNADFNRQSSQEFDLNLDSSMLMDVGYKVDDSSFEFVERLNSNYFRNYLHTVGFPQQSMSLSEGRKINYQDKPVYSYATAVRTTITYAVLMNIPSNEGQFEVKTLNVDGQETKSIKLDWNSFNLRLESILSEGPNGFWDKLEKTAAGRDDIYDYGGMGIIYGANQAWRAGDGHLLFMIHAIVNDIMTSVQQLSKSH